MSRTHRAADIGHNLWSSYNVAQENLIRGGIMNTDTRRRSKAIKSIQKDLELNTKLWDLGTKYYSMATA